ncbi:asparaginase [Roseisalinus antarcticus]|uniref:L-asparaginase II n=1 Tax=Roseisalinus antarcticus TaxID=254357 RepID=A0A1Y5T904_9RHOB|nr:asparaginase [Roseisalinus antarcticus]SLN58555.1 L-asparaginase II [Roseisalinus antarcticus]
MPDAERLVELSRGGRLESYHIGHAVIAEADGTIRQAWGDPDALIYPRSSCKMIQALPLAESGVALDSQQLAIACASHSGGRIHTELVSRWLSDIGLSQADLLCGPMPPKERETRHAMIRADDTPGRIHNWCSGKHTGFLHMTRHLGADHAYCDPDHPLQQQIRATFDEVTGETSPGYGIDGCSAPNFACSLSGFARAIARFAAPGPGVRGAAMTRLTGAMIAHPELIAGEGISCTVLGRAARGRAAIKSGAEGMHIAIVPDLGIGIAVKISDGAQRASDCVMAALLVREGVLDPADPAVRRYLTPELTNWDGQVVGEMHAVLS